MKDIYSYNQPISTYRDYWTDEEVMSNQKGYYSQWCGNLDKLWDQKDFNQSCLCFCPFCHSQTNEVIIRKEKPIELYKCICGWWSVYSSNWERSFWEHHYNGDSAVVEEEVFAAILNRFNISQKDIPTEALIKEINSNHNLLNKVNTSKFEILIKEIFADYFGCKIIHCGKTNDGGIDLYMPDNEYPIAFQVKRREKENSVESVQTIRDFLGAMVINNYRKGIIVSTADHFSRESVKIQNYLLNSNKVTAFELFDKKKIIDLISKIRIKEPWEEIIEKIKNK